MEKPKERETFEWGLFLWRCLCTAYTSCLLVWNYLPYIDHTKEEWKEHRQPSVVELFNV